MLRAYKSQTKGNSFGVADIFPYIVEAHSLHVRFQSRISELSHTEQNSCFCCVKEVDVREAQVPTIAQCSVPGSISRLCFAQQLSTSDTAEE